MGCMKELEEHDHAWDLLHDCGMICGVVAFCLACMTNGLCGRWFGDARDSIMGEVRARGKSGEARRDQQRQRIS